MSAECLAAMRALTASAESDNAVSLNLPPGTVGELRPILGQTVSYVLGRRPRLLGYVDGR